MLTRNNAEIFTSSMELFWTQLPLELSEKVCNALPKVRTISQELKDQIECGRLFLHAKSWQSWNHRDKWTIVSEGLTRWHWVTNGTNLEHTFFIDGCQHYSTEELCLMFWSGMTDEERIDYLATMGPDSEFGDDIEREYSHWEEVIETRWSQWEE
jgi:hypothetical protein